MKQRIDEELETELPDEAVSANEFTGALQKKATSEEVILYYHRLFNRK